MHRNASVLHVVMPYVVTEALLRVTKANSLVDNKVLPALLEKGLFFFLWRFSKGVICFAIPLSLQLNMRTGVVAYVWNRLHLVVFAETGSDKHGFQSKFALFMIILYQILLPLTDKK